MLKRKGKLGQIWVETVLYTLIGLALIGLVLGFVTPRINEAKEGLLVEQTIESLNALDNEIDSVLQAPGNIRQIDFTMKKGEFFIDGEGDKLRFVLTGLKKPYSEPGEIIEMGRVNVITTREQKSNSVELTIDYTNSINLTYFEGGSPLDIEKKFTQAATPYKFSIKNHGNFNDNLVVVSMEELS